MVVASSSSSSLWFWIVIVTSTNTSTHPLRPRERPRGEMSREQAQRGSGGGSCCWWADSGQRNPRGSSSLCRTRRVLAFSLSLLSSVLLPLFPPRQPSAARRMWSQSRSANRCLRVRVRRHPLGYSGDEWFIGPQPTRGERADGCEHGEPYGACCVVVETSDWIDTAEPSSFPQPPRSGSAAAATVARGRPSHKQSSSRSC